MPVSAQAYEIVVLKSADIRPYNEALEGFRSSCDCRVREIDLGEAEGGDISKKLGSDPDAIFAIGMDALGRLQSVADVPVVYAMVPPLQTSGLQRKNFYGVSMYISAGKFLDAMTDVFPDARRIGVVYDPKNSESFVSEALKAAQSRDIELVLKKAARPADVPPLVNAMKDKIDVFWMLPDMTVTSPEAVKYLLLFSFQNRVPVFTFSNKYVELGALAALNIVPFDMGVQAGEIAKRLAGTKANITPARSDARKTVLTVNRKVAKKLGIRLGEDILRKAQYAD